MTVVLDADVKERFERDGFAVVPRLVPAERCDEVRARMDEIVATFDPSAALSVFTTDEQTRVADEYFLTSGGEIRFFLEEEAVVDGTLVAARDRALNKVGHALHDLDPVFDEFSRSPELAALAERLGPAEPVLLQSMYIFKHPGIGGEVGLHQDATFLWTEPRSVMGLWVALEDATVENGCLWALPGGHRLGVKRRFRRDGRGGVEFVELDETPFPMEGLVPLEAPKGTVVALDGALPHRSDPNRSPISRHAYTVHVISAEADYPPDNWLQRPHLPLRGF
jgi:phytanoyl-CoA hydroxylase